MNNVLDLEYIDEQRLMDDINSKDDLLVSIENDISTIERYRDMHECGILQQHHVRDIQNIAMRYSRYNPSMESYSVSLEKSHAGGLLAVGLLTAALVGIVTFVSLVVGMIVKIFTGKPSKTSPSSSYRGPTIEIIRKDTPLPEDSISKRLNESIERLSKVLGNRDVASMALSTLYVHKVAFNENPRALFDKLKPRMEFSAWRTAMAIAYIEHEIFHKWLIFVRIDANLIHVTTVKELHEYVRDLFLNNWFPKSVFTVISKEYNGLFANVPQLLTSRADIFSFTNHMNESLTKIIRFQNTVTALTAREEKFDYVAAQIVKFKSESDELKKKADELYDTASEKSMAANSIIWFRTINPDYISKYNSSVEFNKNRMSEGVENIARQIVGHEGKDYVNSIEAYFKKCMAKDENLEQNKPKWDKLMTDYGKIIPTTVSSFMRAYLQYAKCYIHMGRIIRSWNKFAEEMNTAHDKIIKFKAE